MGNESWLISLSLLLVFILPTITHTKSTIEPCSSSHSCYSLLSYRLPWDSKISEIAYRFQLNITDILASNALSPTIPFPINQIFKAKSLVKLPTLCSCVNGIRRSTSVTYTVKPADTLDTISADYGRLVSEQQIKSTNDIDRNNPLASGQSLVIPLPCTCFNNTNNGITSVYMSYVVQSGESLSKLGAKFGTTVQDLVDVNGLGQPDSSPGDILAIPLTACSSANLDWSNESLIVPNGSYALTANNCIKCICGPNDLNLQCLTSGLPTPCSHLQCERSKLLIGDKYVQQTPNGTCNIIACVYRGHVGHRIHRSLVNSSHIQCSDHNRSNQVGSPLASPSSQNPMIPFSVLSPSKPPLSASNHTSAGSRGSNHGRRHDLKSSSGAIHLCQTLASLLLMLECSFLWLVL